jgi:hypothetical protein
MTDQELEQLLRTTPEGKNAMADIERAAHRFASKLFVRKVTRYARCHLGEPDPETLLPDLPIPPREIERMHNEAKCFERRFAARKKRKPLRQAREWLATTQWGHA